jgi:hypothetical protein
MSLKMRLVPIILIVGCSLGLGALLFRMAAKIIPHEGSSGYAALAVDASRPDREIGELIAELLSKSAMGSSYISESTQTVFLDNFGELEAVPLDKWQGRIEDFDPRHDGYAEKLEAFFVRNDKRLFFIPLLPEANKLGAQKIEAAFSEILGDTAFSIEFLGYDRPIAFYFLMFAGAVLLSVLVSKSHAVTLALAPLFTGFAFTGSIGLALSAVLLAISSVIAVPLRELFAARRYGDAEIAVWARIKHSFHPVTRTKLKIKHLPSAKQFGLLLSIVLFFLLIGLYVYIGITNKVPLAFEGAVFACVCIVLSLALWAESNRGGSQDHIRFMPVPIIGSTAITPVFTRGIIPFTVAAFLALVLPDKLGLNQYRAPGYAGYPEYLIQKSDYESHLAFQTSFSFTPLGAKGTDNTYVQYYLGEDGLITGTKEYDGYLTGTASPPDTDGVRVHSMRKKNIGNFDAFPPFSLENLMDFLRDSGHNEQNIVKTGVETQDLLPIALLILPCILALLNIGQRYRKKNMLVYNEKWNLFRKRIAA